MRTMLFLLFTLLAATVVRSEDAPAEKNQLRLTGVVTDGAWGKPYAGAKVYSAEFAQTPEKWITADENGEFTLYVDRDDQWSPTQEVLYARSADGKQIGAINYSTPTDHDENFVIIMPMPATRVTGTVVGADGNPVPGALVESCGFEYYSTTTDAKGAFEMLLPDRGGILFASHEDFGVDFVGITQQATSETPIYDRMYRVGELVNQRTPVRLTLRPAKPITIRVETETGVPLPGVGVCPLRIKLSAEVAKRHGIDTSLTDPLTKQFFSTEQDGEADADGKIKVAFSFQKPDELVFFPPSWYGVTGEDGTVVFDQIPESILENAEFSAGASETVRRQGFPMHDGTRYFIPCSSRLWHEMNESGDARIYTIPRAGCLAVNVKLPDGTPAPGVEFFLEHVESTFPLCGTGDDGKIWMIEKLPCRVNMYGQGDPKFERPVLKDLDFGDGKRVKEVDYVYDGILLHGNVYPPEGAAARGSTMQSFRCGTRTFYSEKGEYRYVIPRKVANYEISLDTDSVWTPDDEEFTETLKVKGDEKDIRFDIHLKRSGKSGAKKKRQAGRCGEGTAARSEARVHDGGEGRCDDRAT